MLDLSVQIGSLRLENPVMPASGTFSEGLAQVFDLNRLGALVCKTVTAEPREGNPAPRVAELQNSALFSIGIPSKGVKHFIEHTLPFYSQYTPPLIASISAESIEAFGELAARISVPGVAAIEANISCPNLKKNGQAFGMDAEISYQVVRAMKHSTTVPIWPKLTPNSSSISEVAQALEAAGADAIVVGNALLGMAIDVESRLPMVANVTGGVTGPAFKPVLLRMAYQCAQTVKIPVIGCGGISSAEDALEYILAGATAVQVGTANFVSPLTMLRLLDDLRAYCLRHNVHRLRDLVGAMRRHHLPLSHIDENLF